MYVHFVVGGAVNTRGAACGGRRKSTAANKAGAMSAEAAARRKNPVALGGSRPRRDEEGGRADSADGAVRIRPEPGARRGAAARACTRIRGSPCRSGSGRRNPKPTLARGRAARREGLEPNGGS
eukprot:scaffold135733_cov105-Phaeocystis_antarctica.AAC.2